MNSSLNNHITAQTREENRSFKRVKVTLRGVILFPNQTLQKVETLNISEGGIAVLFKNKCKPIPGSEVELHLDGVICAEDNNRIVQYKMLVTRVLGDTIALRFCS